VNDSELPADVVDFLARHIDSVEQLETLLLLHREPERGWSATEAARALYSRPESVGRRLAVLHLQGLLRVSDDEPEPCFHYAPNTSEAHAAVGRLADAYRERRTRVVTLIASRPMDNVRAFADAFRIRKDPPKEK
jgi:hypothetical protein